MCRREKPTKLTKHMDTSKPIRFTSMFHIIKNDEAIKVKT